MLTMWGELTPRGNMVHKGIEREDGVHAQLVLGSLKSSQDFRRTYYSSVGACSSHPFSNYVRSSRPA